jgi:hypothetical protein
MPDTFLICPYTYAGGIFNVWNIRLTEQNVVGDGYCYAYATLSLMT